MQTVKEGLRKMDKGTVEAKVKRFLFTYRVTPHTTTSKSQAELLMGHKLKMHLDLFYPDERARVEQKQLQQLTNRQGRGDWRELEGPSVTDLLQAEDGVTEQAFEVSQERRETEEIVEDNATPGMVQQQADTAPLLESGQLPLRHSACALNLKSW
ncbi:hypothetical protein AAFF_G00316050 [Aldrovandia affinis]|uniref:Uncharacterized protein n=1 Tax=Aldrovandia affinis TaxID=143900 RepID=A0AAD7SNC8_9TELE|nr:hypothetical protein AAFF_G00316050 [Aldrovandia affinis]